jgi:transposase InsO family protein
VEHEQAIAEVRRQRGWGPDRIALLLGLSRATVHRTIRRLGLQRQRPAPEPARRYQREHPGELLHIDTKKLGSLRRGIGRRIDHTRESPPSKTLPAGYIVLYAALDDASRLAYTEVLADERGETAAGFMARAVRFFSQHGIRTERILTDNGSPFVSGAWLAACANLGVRHRRTRPYRPQTNGKVERFFRTTLEECLYVHSFDSDRHRARSPAGLRLLLQHRTPTPRPARSDALSAPRPRTRTVTNLVKEQT